MNIPWGDDAVDDSAYNDPEPDDDQEWEPEWFGGPDRYHGDMEELVLRVKLGREIEVVGWL